MSPRWNKLQGFTPYRNTKHKATKCTTDDVIHTLEHTKISLNYCMLTQATHNKRLKRWHFSFKVDFKRYFSLCSKKRTAAMLRANSSISAIAIIVSACEVVLLCRVQWWVLANASVMKKWYNTSSIASHHESSLKINLILFLNCTTAVLFFHSWVHTWYYWQSRKYKVYLTPPCRKYAK